MLKPTEIGATPTLSGLTSQNELVLQKPTKELDFNNQHTVGPQLCFLI
jgi:hypothetical protein